MSYQNHFWKNYISWFLFLCYASEATLSDLLKGLWLFILEESVQDSLQYWKTLKLPCIFTHIPPAWRISQLGLQVGLKVLWIQMFNDQVSNGFKSHICGISIHMNSNKGNLNVSKVSTDLCLMQQNGHRP